MSGKNVKLTFFDSVAIANREKIHSQIFEWFFNNPEFSNEIKTNILVDLFELDKYHKTFEQILCMPEYKSIDFILKADDELFVIENKLKSFQHDNQLKRYETVIDEDESFLCKGLKHNDNLVHLILLSVINERSQSGNWKEKTYRNLVDILNNIVPKIDKEVKGFSNNILKEYIKSWENMLKVMDTFLTEHEKCPNVFIKSNKYDNYMKKFENQYENLTEEYIKIGNYEAIFEMALLDKIAKAMNVGKEFGYQIAVSERNGEPLIQFIVKKFKDNENTPYMLGIQFQRNTIKLNYRHLNIDDYKKSSKENIPLSILNTFKKIAKENKGFSVRSGNKLEYCCMHFSLQKNYFESHSIEKIIDVFVEKYFLLENFIEDCYTVIKGDSDWHNH